MPLTTSRVNASTIEVHLGPEWYLDRQNFSVEVGDRWGSIRLDRSPPVLLTAFTVS
jgi:hypothetical protein